MEESDVLDDLDGILKQIRPYRSSLTAFFSMMPKGGDLHHHYSGSIYGESYIDYVVQKNFFVNTETLEVLLDVSKLAVTTNWVRFSELKNLDKVKLDLLRKWSVKDFVKGVQSTDEHFFATFLGFSAPSKEDYIQGLRQLKKRALNQRLSHIETIFFATDVRNIKIADSDGIDSRLLKYQLEEDSGSVSGLLELLYRLYAGEIQAAADLHNDKVKRYHVESQIEDESFVMRYQNYVARFRQPVDVFVELAACFHSASKSDLIVGVNIVAAENGEVAMRDYWLHMQFFKFLENKYTNVHFAIHAGELVSGMVQPENLGTHIRESLVLSNLRRIGHAVDIIYDNKFIETIETLKSKGIAIEINLSSNEFILGVANDLHPIELYYGNGVPIVICTDDEGVLRTSITEQYVLLAYRYNLSYREIKKVVLNSILYSNIEDQSLVDKLLDLVNTQFKEFESDMHKFFKRYVFDDDKNIKFRNTFSVAQFLNADNH